MSATIQAPDWSSIPAPDNDGGADHLAGAQLPDITLTATAGGSVTLSDLKGLSVLYIYPMTGHPDRALPADWDEIPGARGCTPQSCAFRDHFADLQDLGVTQVYGLSTQSTEDQQEAAARLHLPFPVLSDENLALAKAMGLPLFETEGLTLLKRMALVVEDATIVKVFYPVFPPDRNAADVMEWLTARG